MPRTITYKEYGYEITEFLDASGNIKATVKVIISETEDTIPKIIEPTIEEQILAETHYQTALIEMNMLGGV